MTYIPTPDYSTFDRPEILQFLFHPRAGFPGGQSSGKQLTFDMEDGVSIGAAFHAAATTAPNLIFFHGNGEIVSDYDDLAPQYTQQGINFFALDYRGYGLSNGTPTVAAMMADSLVLFDSAVNWLRDNAYIGPVVIMGRSLGSASAIEIAHSRSDVISALIVESGFAYVLPLLSLLGVRTDGMGLHEKNGPCNDQKIKTVQQPTLIIHAEYDHIIPFSDGVALYENAGSSDKSLVQIKGADHNSIFYHGFSEYMTAVTDLIKSIS